MNWGQGMEALQIKALMDKIKVQRNKPLAQKITVAQAQVVEEKPQMEQNLMFPPIQLVYQHPV